MNTLPLMDGAIAAFFHLMPLLVLFPIPGLDRLPAFVRVFFCLALAVAMADIVPVTGTPLASAIPQFLLGLALALGVHSCLAGLHIGGHLIDTQAGTNAASIFNPTQSGSGVFAEFLMTATAVTVLLSDSLLLLLGKTLALNPGSASELLTPNHFGAYLELLGRNMVAGFLVTFPIVAGLWLMDIMATASSRLLPHSNVYFLFLPVKTLFAALLFIAGASLLLSGADRLVMHAVDA